MIWMSFIKRCSEHILIKRKLSVQPEKGFTESEMLDHLHKLANKTK